ncbi:mucin-3A-like [Osmerus eperlanus]|uniref:mucin-3A-like n=1 Tax=Osmerus eperlanus TaxID=29151 RepID=UPI002E1577DE
MFNTIFKEVQTAVEDIKSCSAATPGCPEFQVTSTQAPVKEDLDPTAVCRKSVDPKLAKYYSPVNIGGKLECVNRCIPGHPEPFTCQHDGTCAVSVDEGPQCYCLHTGSTWYMGANCNHPINKIGFYVGMSVMGLVLVVLVGVLTAYLLLTKQRQRRNKDSKQKIVNQWLEDDFEWSSPNRTAANQGMVNPVYPAGEFNRPGSAPPPSYTSHPVHYPDSSRYLQTTYEQQSPSYHLPQLALHDFSSNQQIHINRPRIRTSSDM